MAELQGMKKAAREMAAAHGLDAQRVLAVFRRISEIGWWQDPSSSSPLLIASRVLGAEAALALFESADPSQLLDSVRIVFFLHNPHMPLYTHGQLKHLLEEYLAHQERNRSSLLKTGHPETSFGASPFLDWHLSRLYYTKFPLTLQAGRTPDELQDWELFESRERYVLRLDEYQGVTEEYQTYGPVWHMNPPPYPDIGAVLRDSDGNVVYDYTWGRISPLPPLGPVEGGWANGRLAAGEPEQVDGAGSTVVTGRREPDDLGPLYYTEDGQAGSECSYGEAALLRGLSVQDAARLGEVRPRILELRTAVLRRAASALGAGTAHELWSDSLGMLKEAFTGEETEWLMSMDEQLGALDGTAVAPWELMPTLCLHNGGLTDLLRVLGHCENELSFGLAHVAADLLQRVCRESGRTLIQLSYYELAAGPYRAETDEVLGLIRRRWPHYFFGYGNSCLLRLRAALEAGEFREEARLSLRVRAEHRTPAQHRLEATAHDVLSWLELTGALPPREAHGSGEAAENAFERKGEHWVVTYGGRTCTLEDTTGVGYVGYLVAHPHRGFTGVELMRETGMAKVGFDPDPHDEDAAGGPGGDEALADFELDPIIVQTSQNQIMDKKYEDDFWGQVGSLKRRAELAEARGDKRAAADLRTEAAELLRVVNPGLRRPGAAKTFDDASKRAKRAVRIGINRTLTRIRRSHPTLYEHLRAAIPSRGDFVYRPPQAVRWRA